MIESINSDANIKIALTGGVAAFCLGAVFWAGATYNRVQAIETHLGSIDTQLTQMSNQQAAILVLQDRQNIAVERLDRIENAIKQLK